MNTTPNASARMPSPESYEQEYKYWPWGKLIERVAEYVSTNASPNAIVVDYMCGTAFLLREICRRRPDIVAYGCDINPAYVEFANRTHVAAHLKIGDATAIQLHPHPDYILCTAGIHHLGLSLQPSFLKKLESESTSETELIIGEIAIPDHTTEIERQLSALQFNFGIVDYGIRNSWPAEMIEIAIDITRNDVLFRGEFKRDLAGWMELIKKHLQVVTRLQTWKAPFGGGDYIFVCKRR